MSFLLSVIALIAVFMLNGRISRLERMMKEEKTPAEQAAAVVVSPIPSPAPSPASLSVSATETPSRISRWSDEFAAWIREDWMMKVGTILVILGVGWFVVAATLGLFFDALPPIARIMIGILTGVGTLAFGFKRMRTFLNQGSVFVVLGASVILLSVFAARYLYPESFPAFPALATMFLSTFVVSLTAVHFRVRMLAFIGLLLSGIVPLLVHSPAPDYVGLFSYLGVVVLGTLWVILLTEWRDLLVGALLIVTAYSLPHWAGFIRVDEDILVIFAYVFTTIFFSANIVGYLRAREVTEANIAGTVLNGLFILSWVASGVSEDWRSLVLSFWAVAFVSTAFVLFRLTRNPKPLISYAAIGVACLGTATALELHGAVLGVAFTLEAGAMVLLTHLFGRSVHATSVASFLLLVPGFLTILSMGEYARSGPMFDDNFALILLFATTLVILGAVVGKVSSLSMRQGGILDAVDHALPKALLAIAVIAYSILLWLMLARGLDDDTATLISLLLYTIFGIGGFFIGVTHNSRSLSRFGVGYLVFVILHLLLVDIWALGTELRILAFIGVGILLIATAFRGKKLRAQLTGSL